MKRHRGEDMEFTYNCATVDPDNVIVESDESNNTECVTTKIVR